MKNKMILKMLGMTLLISLLMSCSAPPKVKTPKGDRRVPVNNVAELSAFETAIDDEYYRSSQIAEQEELQSTVADLKRQVVELKKQIQTNNIALKPSTITDNRVSAAAKNVVSPVMSASKKESVSIEKEWIDRPSNNQADDVANNKKLAKLLKDQKNLVRIRDGNVIFTINFSEGKKDFKPSKEIRSVLLELAKNSESIEVRGYTDSNQESRANDDIALARAVSAYDFLVMHGIAPNNIYVSYEGSGNFIADNSTAEGKARNRRVEIEIAGTDTSYFH